MELWENWSRGHTWKSYELKAPKTLTLNVEEGDKYFTIHGTGSNISIFLYMMLQAKSPVPGCRWRYPVSAERAQHNASGFPLVVWNERPPGPPQCGLAGRRYTIQSWSQTVYVSAYRTKLLAVQWKPVHIRSTTWATPGAWSSPLSCSLSPMGGIYQCGV